LKPGQKAAEAACDELREETGLIRDPNSLEPITDEDAIIERVVLPDKAIINFERKTAYLVEKKVAAQLK